MSVMSTGLLSFFSEGIGFVCISVLSKGLLSFFSEGIGFVCISVLSTGLLSFFSEGIGFVCISVLSKGLLSFFSEGLGFVSGVTCTLSLSSCSNSSHCCEDVTLQCNAPFSPILVPIRKFSRDDTHCGSMLLLLAPQHSLHG